MFMKSSAPTRNEPITRKEVRSVLGSPAPAPATPPPEPAKTGPVNVQPAPETPSKTTETTADKPMGARLIVGPDVKLKGAEILDCDTLVVEGRVEATMDSRIIRIADQGTFSGKVSIDVAEIHGSFDGELTARSQLIIHSTGKVSGKIRYGKLVIDEGGELCGDINALSAERGFAEPALPPRVANG
ncbi:MAG: polymer-forming cytoskeletal protein [Azonexaceae bacterium]|uniref:bactofilin family protein n=1 Tax=Azonexus sp. R2A61 TaxID=2744443 RepID=UPI001F2F95F2|nr:polymer-forming cytoskeletal protein [Azonexus sp. R2A61]MCE1240621.1 polymer-forming cytoskeletal protein [Azonexaceae bacterium]